MNNPETSALALVDALTADLRRALALIREAQALARSPALTDFPRSGTEARARHKRRASAAHGLGLDAARKRDADKALAEAEAIVARVLG